MLEHTPDRVLDFWLGPLRGGVAATSEEHWRERMLRWRVGVFARAHEDVEFSQAQRDVCEALHRKGHAAFFSPAEQWDTPKGWLAKLIVLDQFGRCVHRGTPLAYENDELTAPMLRHICEQRWDREVYDLTERMWVYVALSHPEDVELQELSVAKWTEWCHDLVDASPPEYRRVNQRVSWAFVKAVIEHSEAVLIHGKFPHRNPILCRPHRAGDLHYLTSELRPLWSFTQPPRPLYYALHATLHEVAPDSDCQTIDAETLATLQDALELPTDEPAARLDDVFQVLRRERVEFRDLYRHATLRERAAALDAIQWSSRLEPHRRRIRQAIFKNDAAIWPPTSAKTAVPRVIDVPALNLAIGCPHLSAGDVSVPRAAIRRFVEVTGFAACPISELFERYLELTAGTQASYETTAGGHVHRTVSIGRRPFKQLAGCLFEDTPARDDVLSTLYELLDLDYDGTVDAAELVVALNALCTGSVDEKLDVCFRVFDRDASGCLDSEELWDLMHTTLLRGLHLVEALFLKYQPQGPGGGAQEDEHVVMFSLANFAAIEQAALRALSEADTDGDGAVTRDEFAVWAKSHPLLGQLFGLYDTLFG